MLETVGLIDTIDQDLLNHPGCVHFTFRHFADYLAEPCEIVLHIVLLNAEDRREAIITRADISNLLPEEATGAIQQFSLLVTLTGCNPIPLDAPLPLSVIDVTKPWGREIWYTGIEARGQSMVYGVPLPWLLAVFGPTLGYPMPPMLLKILAPLPDDNLGDLYFEMHEEKTEVYVVTAIDLKAWPDGIGKIRYGFNPEIRDQFDSDTAFLESYITVVKQYEATRRLIDARLDELIAQNGLPEPLSTVDQKHLITLLPEDLQTQEKAQRDAMYAYTRLVDLKIGDVVRVPPFLPHSLQHGVRVVEFQTPHYERFILSFGQKVLTQDTWDTEQVAARVEILPSDIAAPANIEPGIDLVADFDAFQVLRLQIKAGDVKRLTHDKYGICMGIEGKAMLTDNERVYSGDHGTGNNSSLDNASGVKQHVTSGIVIEPEEAFLVPPNYSMIFRNDTDTSVCVLVALSKTRSD